MRKESRRDRCTGPVPSRSCGKPGSCCYRRQYFRRIRHDGCPFRKQPSLICRYPEISNDVKLAAEHEINLPDIRAPTEKSPISMSKSRPNFVTSSAKLPTRWRSARTAARSRPTFPNSRVSIRKPSAWSSSMPTARSRRRRQRRAVLDPEHLEGVHADAGARQDRRPAVAAGRPRAVRQPRSTPSSSSNTSRAFRAIPSSMPAPSPSPTLILSGPSAARGAGRNSALHAVSSPTIPRSSIDEAVAASEQRTGFRNVALANYMKSFGVLDNPVDYTLGVYFHHCAIAMSCRQLAMAGRFLAYLGRNPSTGFAGGAARAGAPHQRASC